MKWPWSSVRAAPSVAGAAMVALTALAGCGGCDAERQPRPGAASATSARSTAAPTSTRVTVHYAGEEIPVELTARSRLLLRDQLPAKARDATKWVRLSAQGTHHRSLTLKRFGEVYGHDYEVYLYLNAAGRPTLGLFRPIQEAMPARVKARLRKPHLELADVQRVQVHLTQPPLPQPIQRNGLALDVMGVAKQLSAAQLQAIADNADRPGGRRARGWPLLKVVALAEKKPLKDDATVKVYTRDGHVAALSVAQLRAKNTRATLRYNRRGMLMLRIDQGASAGAGLQRQQWRDVVKVVVP